MAQSSMRTKRWTRAEYERLVALGALASAREHKGSLYARAGVPEYWIVNLVDDALEVYRDPAPDGGAVHGWRYRSATTLRAGQEVAPLAAPGARIPVADLLP